MKVDPAAGPACGRWLFVSDVHLDTIDHPRPTARALARFVEHVAERCQQLPIRLVLLGDVFELLGPLGGGADAASRRLDAVASRNGHVFSALRTCIRAGVHVDVVSGNHDLDLVRPAVADRLRHHLDVSHSDVRVQFWPWLYVVPGVLYAEHGNQHHDLNRFPQILDPYSRHRRDELHTPLLATRDRLAGANRFSRRSHAVAVLESLATTWWGERTATRSCYRSRVGNYAESVGLEPELVMELERLSRVRLLSTTRRLAGRLFGGEGDSPDDYLIAAAAALHRLTASRHAATPVYVFGHTHIARKVPIDGGSAHYLNCGTWSSFLRAGDPAADDPSRFPFVEVIRDDHGVHGSVRWWRPPPAEQRLDAPTLLSLDASRS